MQSSFRTGWIEPEAACCNKPQNKEENRVNGLLVCSRRHGGSLLKCAALGESSGALTGLGNLWTVNPGRRSLTRFALRYFLSGLGPFEIGISSSQMTCFLCITVSMYQCMRTTVTLDDDVF
jgi:hypothetical protein